MLKKAADMKQGRTFLPLLLRRRLCLSLLAKQKFQLSFSSSMGCVPSEHHSGNKNMSETQRRNPRPRSHSAGSDGRRRRSHDRKARAVGSKSNRCVVFLNLYNKKHNFRI